MRRKETTKSSLENGFGPLQSAKILDLTRATAGPFGTRLLADLGAQVIKIESPPKPGETSSRWVLDSRYSFHGEDLHFLTFNRNKKSIAINLKSPRGKEVFYDLVKKCDVVFDNFRPSAVKGLGIDYQTLSKMNPRIISCSLSGFGTTGPLKDAPAFDEVVQAISGIIDLVKARDASGRLRRPGLAWGDLTGGMFAAFGIVSALYSREHTGKGQLVDVALLDGLMALYVQYATYQLNLGVFEARMGVLLYGSLKAKDKYITLAIHRDAFWENLCKALHHEEWMTDPRFSTVGARIKNREEACRTIETVLGEKSADEWLKILDQYDVPCGPVNSAVEAIEQPQLAARNMIVSIKHSSGDYYKDIGNPVKMSSMKEEVFSSPPGLGQHTREVLAEIAGYSLEKIEELRKAGVIFTGES